MKLFISYAHADTDRVAPLIEAFQAADYHPWYDISLLPGKNWQEELAAQIADADALVYMLTVAAVQSEWCRWEFATAVRLGKPVVPILLDGAAPSEANYPPALKALQYVDFSEGMPPGMLIKLTRALEEYGHEVDPASVVAPATPAGSPLQESPAPQTTTYNIKQSSTHSTNVQQIGVVEGNLDLSTHSHDLRGASFNGITNISSRLDRVHQSLTQNRSLPADDRAELAQLVSEMKAALEAAQPPQAEDAELVAELTDELIEKASAPEPNPRRIEISGQNLIQAAENLASVMPLVLTIAGQIVTRIQGLVV